MFARSLITVTVIANAVLGSFCMMPMAFAAPIPMQADEAMEMNMTPIVPMSMAHCEHCTHVEQQNNAPMSNSCAGHCLAKAHDALTAASGFSSSCQIFIALPSAFPIAAEPANVPEKCNASTTPVVNLALARGVVMIN